MKRLTFVLLILFCSLTINAQWYYGQFSVTNINDLNKDQLNLSLTKTNQMIKAGQILTGLGTLFSLAGVALYSNGINGNYQNLGTGSALMGIGGFAMAIGIPAWIGGEYRKNDIEIALVKFSDTASIGVGFKINF